MAPKAFDIAVFVDIQAKWGFTMPVGAFDELVAALTQSAPQASPAPAFYIGGPYGDGSYSVCEVASGRVVRKFQAEDDLRGPQLYKWAHVGFGRFRMMAAGPSDADSTAAPLQAEPEASGNAERAELHDPVLRAQIDAAFQGQPGAAT